MVWYGMDNLATHLPRAHTLHIQRCDCDDRVNCTMYHEREPLVAQGARHVQVAEGQEGDESIQSGPEVLHATQLRRKTARMSDSKDTSCSCTVVPVA